MKKELSHLTQVFLGSLSLLFFLEIISFGSWQTPNAQWIIFVIVLFFVMVAGLKNPRIPVYALFSELVIGGKGYMLYADVAGQNLSLRLGLFLVAFIIFIVHWLRAKNKTVLPEKLRYPFIALISVIILGSLHGYTQGYPLQHIFLDMNGYLFLGAFLPLFFFMTSQEHFHTLFSVIAAALVELTLKSYFILFVFSHKMTAWMSNIYPWVRKTGVGEITLLWGDFYRVFIQSHILIVATMFIILAMTATWFYNQRPLYLRRNHIFWLLFSTLSLAISIDILSYSRSFWLASGTVTVALGVYYLWKKYTIRALSQTLGLGLLSVVCGVSVLLIVINIPIGTLNGAGIGAVSLIDERTDIAGDDATGSRFNLLPPLLEKIQEHPVIGSGFATTVTYDTLDWRALETHPDGRFTTYSFEWGYLDIITEVGLIGMLIYLWFSFMIVQKLWQRIHNTGKQLYFHEGFFTGLLFAMLFLYITHIFTPYLNHPIGLGLIGLTALIAFRYDTT